MAISVSASSSTPAAKDSTPSFLNMKDTEPSVPRLPPNLPKAWRTSATVRTLLSVRQSTIAATGARRDADFADHLGEDLAALRVDRVLAGFDGRATTHGDIRLLVLRGRKFYRGGRGPAPAKRPSRRNAIAWSAASCDQSRPLWLTSRTTWSATPARRVSSTATVPSWSPPK